MSKVDPVRAQACRAGVGRPHQPHVSSFYPSLRIVIGILDAQSFSDGNLIKIIVSTNKDRSRRSIC
jgi:hypothetical protein